MINTYIVRIKCDSDREFEFDALGFDTDDALIKFFMVKGGEYTYMFALDAILLVMLKQVNNDG